MTTQRFKKNDFVFCEFKLQQIVAMEGSNITEVSDGLFSHSGNNLNDRCYELSLKNKTVSEFFERIHSQLHELKNNALNHPDMNRYLINKWCDCCFTKDVKVINNIIESTEKWFEAVKNYVEIECRSKEIDGVRIFR